MRCLQEILLLLCFQNQGMTTTALPPSAELRLFILIPLSHSTNVFCLNSVKISAYHNGSLSIIHDGLDSIETGLETMETCIYSALYLYHDGKIACKVKSVSLKDSKKRKLCYFMAVSRFSMVLVPFPNNFNCWTADPTIIELYPDTKSKEHTKHIHEYESVWIYAFRGIYWWSMPIKLKVLPKCDTFCQCHASSWTAACYI